MRKLALATGFNPNHPEHIKLNKTERLILEFVQLELRAGRNPDGRSINQFYFGGNQYHAFGFEVLSRLEAKGYIATEITVLKPSIRHDGVMKFNDQTKELEVMSR